MQKSSELLARLSPEARVELARKRAQEIKASKSGLDNNMPVDEWIEKHFYVPELHGPIQLAKYQKAVLREAFSKDEDGLLRYSTIVWADVKKSIKSCIAAATMLKVGFSSEWASCYSLANDLKGADSRVGYYTRRAIELNPMLRATCNIRNYRIDLPNHSFIESIPIDPTGEAGSNADMVTFSELWGAHEEGQTRMWTEMTTPPNKFGKSLRWVETYAGYSGESLLLEQLYDLTVKNGEWLDLGMGDLEVFVNRPGRILCLWNTRPRLPWQTKAYYAEQEAILPPNEFLRIHRNQWVSSTNEFIPKEWWEGCHYTKHNLTSMPPMPPRTPCIFAIDAGVSNDHFGITGVWRIGKTVVPFYSKEWIPPKHGKLDFQLPEAEIRRVAKEYNVIEWAYDEFQLHDMTTRLRREGVGYFRPFPQGQGTKFAPGRPVADKLLYDVIQQHRLIHDGNVVLTEHVLNANAQVEGRHERLMLVKRSPLYKIDCAVALSMASCEALRLNIG